MKQIAPNYTYNKTTGVITLTGVNIDRDQLLLIVNTTRNVTYYNFADSATTLQSFSANATPTSLTLNSSVISASSTHANTDALTIYYDDQSTSNLATGVQNGIAGWANSAGGDGSSPIYVALTGTTNNVLGGLQDGDGNIFGVDRDFNVSINGGYLDHLRDGDGNIFGLDRNFPVDVLNAVTTYPKQGVNVTNTTFTSTTPSTTLVFGNAARTVLTVFNEGPGLLYISSAGDGTTCTTTSYQVRLSSGDYWECPAGQITLNHIAVFGTAGTARVSQVT